MRVSRFHSLMLWIPAVILMAGLRLVDLNSDPYRGLDWDTGLMTDEGFYTHNARNVALFGHARTDEFNNMLAAPLVHFLQVGAFTVLGYSSSHARLLSAALSLLTLLVYGVAIKRAFGPRIGVTAVLLLGLDHFNLLFNRMALLDTPAMFLAVCALYAFVRAVEDHSRTRLVWLFTAGALLVAAVTNRSLCIYLVPAVLIAVLFRFSKRPKLETFKLLAGLGAGISAALITYVIFWYLPHRAEIDHMNRYYRTVQVLPDSASRLLENIHIAFLGGRFGFFSNMFRHTPIAFTLALLATGTCLSERRNGRRAVIVLLAAWILAAWLLFAVSSYAPNRYFVTTLPAIFALAAVAMWRLPETLRALSGSTLTSRAARAAIVFLLLFHVLNLLLRGRFEWVSYAAAAVPAAMISLQEPPVPTRFNRWRWASLILALWAGINAGWMADWWLNREYTLYESSRWLQQNLPAGSVLLGDVAPGLGMDTDLLTVNVMKGFANDRKPVESFSSRPRYILTIDGGWKTPYWRERYPRLVEPRRRIKRIRALRWTIGVYPVP